MDQYQSINSFLEDRCAFEEDVGCELRNFTSVHLFKDYLHL